MIKNRKRIVSILLIIISIISIEINSYAHSGRTDANGGHRDNQNKSGLGSYHYHCGGYPAYLHTNGACPYSSSKKNASSSSSSGKSSTSGSPQTKSSGSSSSLSKSSTSNLSSATIPSDVAVAEIKINESDESLEIGQSKILTATVSPSDATDKNITWKSSDESIVTISKTGEIVAKRNGIVEITAISSNGKTSSIKIEVKETPKSDESNVVNTTINQNSNTTNDAKSNKENKNPLGGIAILGLLSGGCYWGYKKYKKKI